MGNLMEIGSVKLRNNLIAAPLAGITDIGFRYMASKMGAGLTVTEMATSRGLLQNNRRTLRTISTHPDARPYSVQLFGDDPGMLAEAARIAQQKGADIVDLNAACPVPKIIKSRSGADLLRNLPRLSGILRAMRKVLEVPLTLKIRSGWDSNSIVATEVTEVARDEGVDAVTLHPRTASQKFDGRADWSIIGEVVSAVDMPIIASGDILGPADALEALDRTGCAGVMIGRAAIGNPFIFREIAAAIEGNEIPAPPTSGEKCDVALEHLDIMLQYCDPKVAVALWRKHLCWYARGIREATRLRNIVFTIWDEQELRELTHRFFGEVEEEDRVVRGLSCETR